MDIIFVLKNSDDKKAYALFKEIIISSTISNEYYFYYMVMCSIIIQSNVLTIKKGSDKMKNAKGGKKY